MDAWIAAAVADGYDAAGVVLVFGVLIWRGYLIPRPTHREVVGLHQTRADDASERADRWEAVALRVLDATERLADPVEVTAKVLTKLPNPARDEAE